MSIDDDEINEKKLIELYKSFLLKDANLAKVKNAREEIHANFLYEPALRELGLNKDEIAEVMKINHKFYNYNYNYKKDYNRPERAEFKKEVALEDKDKYLIAKTLQIFQSKQNSSSYYKKTHIIPDYLQKELNNVGLKETSYRLFKKINESNKHLESDIVEKLQIILQNTKFKGKIANSLKTKLGLLTSTDEAMLIVDKEEGTEELKEYQTERFDDIMKEIRKIKVSKFDAVFNKKTYDLINTLKKDSYADILVGLDKIQNKLSPAAKKPDPFEKHYYQPNQNSK